MRAPANAFPNPLRPDQVEELLDLIRRLADKWEIPWSSLRKALREALMELSQRNPGALSSDRDREDLASLQAGLRQLAEALADPLPAPPEPIPSERLDILLDVLLRRWILERYPGWKVACFFLLWERHSQDIARGLRPFRRRLIEANVLEPQEELLDLAADFLGHLLAHLLERDEARLRQWDPLKGPMGPWLRRVVWQLARDLIRSPRREVPLEEDEGGEEPPWEERFGEDFSTLTGKGLRDRLERALDLEGILGRALNDEERYILWAAYVEGWTDEEIAEALKVRRETVNRRKQRALRKVFCALWQETIREEELPDSRIASVVSERCADRSPEEIAQRLGLSVEEVGTLLEEARRILRRRWDP
ncbi:sigma-70 family RNA polymerase sigma factor [Thermoflexus hugenholtzii]